MELKNKNRKIAKNLAAKSSGSYTSDNGCVAFAKKEKEFTEDNHRKGEVLNVREGIGSDRPCRTDKLSEIPDDAV